MEYVIFLIRKAFLYCFPSFNSFLLPVSITFQPTSSNLILDINCRFLLQVYFAIFISNIVLKLTFYYCETEMVNIYLNAAKCYYTTMNGKILLLFCLPKIRFVYFNLIWAYRQGVHCIWVYLLCSEISLYGKIFMPDNGVLIWIQNRLIQSNIQDSNIFLHRNSI